MTDTDLYTTTIILGMVGISVLTRSFFFLSSKPLTLPDWARRGLNYAPIAALAAVVVPETIMTQGHLVATWQDARLFALPAAIACYAWRRSVLGTIVVGMAVYLPLHIGWGW